MNVWHVKSNLKRHMTRDVMKEKHQLLKQTKVYLTSELCYNPCVKRDHNISFVTARASKRKVNRVPKPRAYSGVWGNAPPPPPPTLPPGKFNFRRSEMPFPSFPWDGFHKWHGKTAFSYPAQRNASEPTRSVWTTRSRRSKLSVYCSRAEQKPKNNY